MISLNDYLYGDHTVPNIVYNYAMDLRQEAITNSNLVDLYHSSFMLGYLEFLEKNEFIATQSEGIKTFYNYLEERYPFLSFIFSGRIKSLVRVEEKYNSYIMECISKYYNENKSYPECDVINHYITRFCDLIAYRFIVNIPQCNLSGTEDKEQLEIKYLYEICNALPYILVQCGFDIMPAPIEGMKTSDLLSESVQMYVKDYIANPKMSGYRSLHLRFFDNVSRCQFEVQLRTKTMDDFAEIGVADHETYEKEQKSERAEREFPEGECEYYDEAFERVNKLQSLDITDIHVNMFTAYSPTLINDHAGLLKGRLITPYEHLSRFQK